MLLLLAQPVPAGILWLITLMAVGIGILNDRWKRPANPRPQVSAPLGARLLEAALIVGVIALMAVSGGFIGINHSGFNLTDADRWWTAQWSSWQIVEHAQRYRQAERRNPGTVEALVRWAPDLEQYVRDPWGREWDLSPGFKDPRTPRDSNDLWVCSRGPSGAGVCPPANRVKTRGLLTPIDLPPPDVAAGPVGHSAHLGGLWSTSEPRRFDRVVGPLALSLFFAAPVAYAAHRAIRRLRGRSVPRLGGLLTAIVVVWITGTLAVIAIPVLHDIQGRARDSNAWADMRRIAGALDLYRAHMGQLPAKLDDLTVAAKNSKGTTARPFLERVPEPLAGGDNRYIYVHRPNGWYVLGDFDRSRQHVVFVEQAP